MCTKEVKIELDKNKFGVTDQFKAFPLYNFYRIHKDNTYEFITQKRVDDQDDYIILYAVSKEQFNGWKNQKFIATRK